MTFFRHALASILAGFVCGLGAIAFHFLSEGFGSWLFASGRDLFPMVMVIPVLGLFLVGLALQRFPGTRLGGVAEVFEEIVHRGGAVSWARVGNVFLSGLVLAFGGSVGPEGPMVQLGALFGSRTGNLFGLTDESLRLLVRAGVAAGIGAAFRAPVAGVMLTLEIFGARFTRGLVPIALAAVTGYFTRIAILGDAYPFRLRDSPSWVPFAALFTIIPLMGFAGAPVGHVFIRLLTRMKTWFPTSWPLFARVTLGGALVGGIGVWFPQVMRAGYPAIRSALDGELPVSLLLLLLLFKIIATSITFGSGAVGGLFAPTLVMGGMFGGAFGYGFHFVAPSLVPNPELYVLIGIVVMFAAIVKGFWSGLFLAAEMSGAYLAIVLPGLVAGGISYQLARRLDDRNVFGLTVRPLELWPSRSARGKESDGS